MKYIKDRRTVRVTLVDFKGSKIADKSITFTIYETTKEEVEELIKKGIDNLNNQ